MAEIPVSPNELSEQERARIRAEMRYAAEVAREARDRPAPKSRVEKALGILGNGFVLLVIGSLITSVLVPRFQRDYESRKQQAALMQEALANFLLYSNSMMQEYYSILPLTQQSDLSREEYLQQIKEIAQIKLRRYDSYARLQAVATVFRHGQSSQEPVIQERIGNFAVSLNAASARIDRWLTNLYCTPTRRTVSPCASFDPRFDPHGEFEAIKQVVVDVANRESEGVATLMVARISQY
jgi:hypothetical protein